ncbi:class I SAM-dependent methyltransferase [Sulfurimonas sp.]
MPRIDSEKFYTSAIDVHGITAKGVNWTSKETQEIRFDIILDMLPDDINSLVDAGCGFGDLYTYMNKKNKTPKRYIGIDSLIDMYSIASKNTAQEIIIADITKDKIPFADYYICSGAMNVLNIFETHLFIRNCFLACGNGFIFNILHGEKESETYNYISTCQIENIAKELKVKDVKMKTGYLKNDITVGFFK